MSNQTPHDIKPTSARSSIIAVVAPAAPAASKDASRDFRQDRSDNWPDRARNSFWSGQRIPLHRAIRRLQVHRRDLLSPLFIPVAANLLMWIFWDDVCLFLIGAQYFFLDPLIADLRFASQAASGLPSSLFLARINADPMSEAQWWTGYALCAALLLLAAAPLRRIIVIRYFAGFFGLIQLASQLYFVTGLGEQTIQAEDYLVDAMTQTVYWIWFTPWLLGLTFNLFPFTLLHKMRLTALAVCHQILFLPVQFAFQSWVLHTGSALWAPLLYFATAMPLNVMMTVAFYGIGMAWPDAERDEE